MHRSARVEIYRINNLRVCGGGWGEWGGGWCGVTGGFSRSNVILVPVLSALCFPLFGEWHLKVAEWPSLTLGKFRFTADYLSTVTGRCALDHKHLAFLCQ